MKYDSWFNDPSFDLDYKEFLQNEAMEILGGITILDKELRMVYINNKYAESMHIDKIESLGKKINEVIKDTKMLEVMETGQPQIGVIYKRNNNTFIVNRLPIYRDGELTGEIGHSTFADIYEIENLKNKINIITRSLNYYKLKAQNFTTAKYSINTITTNDKAMLDIKLLTEKIAKTRSTVLITGESGTGKELFSHAIHSLSSRSSNPFIQLNCAAIPENLLESELFGYERGAFTGALKEGKTGEFEMANTGTLMLDEIDSLSINLQSKLLRVIQEKEIKKIGGSAPIKVDARLIFTTNKDLFELVKKGEFREDLYYRINVMNLRIPPLRERMSDIPLLVNALIKKLNLELGMNITGISDDAIELLKKHNWPGNIRELENCIERAFNYAVVGELKTEHFNNVYLRIDSNYLNSKIIKDEISLQIIRETAEKEAIISALTQSRWNKKKASEILKIDRSVLYDKIKKYNILNID